MSGGEQIAVIWNPSTASAERAAAALEELRRWPEVVIERPREADSVREVISRRRGAGGMVVAAGGDGTVSVVAGALLDSGFSGRFGVLPLGTGNDFARSLEIPFEPAASVATLFHGREREIDAVAVQTSGHRGWYVNMLTGGNTGRYLEAMTSELKERWGPLCYLRGILDVAQNLETFDIRLSVDESPPESLQALNLFLANGRTSGGGLSVSPRAELDDGLVDVVVIRDGEPGEIVGLTAEYLLSDYLEHDLVEFRRGRRVRIESATPLPLTADGDSIGETPVEVEVRPRALRVLVPGEAP